MDDLVQWLRAQLDDDEQTARKLHNLLARLQWTADRALGLQSAIEWNVPRAEWARLMGALPSEPDGLTWVEAVEMRGSALDPARVLREIDAKRQLIARGGPFCTSDCDDPDNEPKNPDTDWTTPLDHHLDCAAYEAAKVLALPYEDRTGYREHWRP
ncbi:DUF6221 family protein [Streptomyces sp. enrichment culture]|uniref:DUF6221 family protein n=1 Tax=Streptomyces sp. enrichment culture TaxID=1795815 RepID=UPI003F547551